jgi:glycerol kinase
VVRALAIDVGSTSVRTALVDDAGRVSCVHQAPLTVLTPSPGEVELDPREIRDLVIQLSRRTLADGGPCAVVGITNQRATTIVFDPESGEALGPALSWQDLRTVIDCLILQGHGLRLAPNQSATKAKWLVEHSGRTSKQLKFATIETWIAWNLSGGAAHVTDQSNAAVTGLVHLDARTWDGNVLTMLGLDSSMMPSIVPTMGHHALASVLEGSPPIVALVGDQSASLFGQSCVEHGVKITFGTGAMLDMVDSSREPTTMVALASGCFPIVVRSDESSTVWGIEAIALAAGSCIEWLRDSLGLVEDAAESEVLATSVSSSDGVWFVPALSGLGTPKWDFGARGGFFGLTRGSTRAHLVRAVLEGIAHRGADLIEAAQRETGTLIDEIRVDGGMTANRFFVQAFANFTGIKVTVSPEREATTRGAGLMALVAGGYLASSDVERLWDPLDVVVPELDDEQRRQCRSTWSDIVARVEQTIPDLSTVKF